MTNKQAMDEAGLALARAEVALKEAHAEVDRHKVVYNAALAEAERATMAWVIDQTGDTEA